MAISVWKNKIEKRDKERSEEMPSDKVLLEQSSKGGN